MLAAVLASLVWVLALTAQASASGPIAGGLDALGATATQQLPAVAHDAQAVPLPAPASPAVPVANDITQTAEAASQTLATTADAVRASGSDIAERARASRPSESGARSESSDGQSGSPSEPALVAGAVAERAARVTSGAGAPSREPTRVIPARIVQTARGIVSPAAERVAKRLERAVQSAPVVRHLGERATRVAGALIGTVVSVAKAARGALAALPSLDIGSSLQPTIASPALPAPWHARATTTATQPFQTRAPLVTSTATAGSAPAATAPLLAAGAVHAVPTQASASQRRGLPSSHAAADESRSAKPSPARGVARAVTARAKPALASSTLAASPAPSPGGVSPASGAGASSGLSASTLLALAALLLLAGPCAMSLLRLAAGSRRPAQFVLIPERPG